MEIYDEWGEIEAGWFVMPTIPTITTVIAIGGGDGGAYRPPVEREPIITIADLEAKIKRMREEDRDRGRPMVAAIDAIHDRRKRMLEWPEVK